MWPESWVGSWVGRRLIGIVVLAWLLAAVPACVLGPSQLMGAPFPLFYLVLMPLLTVSGAMCAIAGAIGLVELLKWAFAPRPETSDDY